MNSIKIVFFMFIVLFLSSISSFSQKGEETGRGLKGKELFIQKGCVRCHTLGRGVFVGPDLLTSKKKYSRDELINWIINPRVIYEEKGKRPVNEGFPPMPTLNVTAVEATKLVDYILSFNKRDERIKGGTIEGVVVNASKENAKLSGVRVTLSSYLGEKNLETYSQITDDKGAFEFKNLPWNRSYEISIRYDGSLYATERMVFPPEDSRIELTLPIYESTDDASDISIHHYHILIKVEDGKVSVAEVIDIVNKGNKIYSGRTVDEKKGIKGTISLLVPENATSVNFLEGISRDNLIINDNLIIDTTPIVPGIRRIAFTYLIPLDRKDVVISKLPELSVEKYTVLIEDGGYAVEVKGLEQKSDYITVGNDTFTKWEGKGDLKVGGDYGLEIIIKKPYIDIDRYFLLKILSLAIFSVFIVAAVIIAKKKRG